MTGLRRRSVLAVLGDAQTSTERPCSPMLDHFMNHSDSQRVRDPQLLKTSDPPTTEGAARRHRQAPA